VPTTPISYYTTGTSGLVWEVWINTDQTTATSTTSDHVWNQWNTTSSSTAITMDYRRHAPPPETEEQRRERQRRQVAENQRRIDAQKQRDAANEKAKELLLSVLTADQRIDFLHRGSFRVEGSKGGKYQIQTGYSGNVRRGRRRYCGHLSDGQIPAYDHMLAQKLLIETDEEAFLAVANASAF